MDIEEFLDLLNAIATKLGKALSEKYDIRKRSHIIN